MIHAVVVTYQPPDVTALLTELSRQCDAVTVVDNGSDSAAVAALRASCRATGAELVAMPANLGIAKAQNIGVARAMTSSPDFILLSDQDSLPAENMTSLLVEAIEEDERIAATGPLPSEDREGADELVYIDRGWSPKRATKEELSRPRLDAAFLLASGCLIRVRALREIGPMREDLFIDHVDLEWGVRARRAGWRLVAVPAARLNHSLGDEVVRLPGRAQPIHVHSPIRNYYIVRNTIALVKWNGFPLRWRIRYTYWAAKYAVFNSFMVGQGPERRRLIARGLRDGVLGRLGPIGSGA